MAVSVVRDIDELRGFDGDVTDFVRLKFCVELQGEPECHVRLSRVLPILQSILLCGATPIRQAL